MLAFGSFGGLMNYYFIYDRSPLDIVAAYTRLTGTPELPPLWALGYHQSKWSYYPDKAVYNLVERFRDLGIPCDAVHLDHHYMEQKEGFTWDRHNFPDAAGMVRSLEEDGVKTVLIVNPGVKINPANPVWTEGLERNYFCRRRRAIFYRRKSGRDSAIFRISRPRPSAAGGRTCSGMIWKKWACAASGTT